MNIEASDISEVLTPDLAIAVRMLACGGFTLEDVQRKPGYALIHASRYDEFGSLQNYCFVLAEAHLNEDQIAAAAIAASHYKACLILVGKSDAEITSVDWQHFISLFGGAVFSTSPLESDFCEQFVVLGHNQLPDGLQGKPDDLFEMYVKTALEFIFGGRVIRYGQDRRFEARADGIVLPSLRFSSLYDAKAYKEGYDITLDSIRQFRSYVDDFSSRYKSYLPNLNSFIVISGHFRQQESTLAERSRDLYHECHVPLCCVNAASLVEIIQLISAYPHIRRSVKWSRIFSDPVLNVKKVQQEIERIKKDAIIPRC